MACHQRTALVFAAALTAVSLSLLSTLNNVVTVKLTQEKDSRNMLAYDGMYDVRPATWYFPGPSTSNPNTLGYTYNTGIYQSPGYTTEGYTATPSYSYDTFAYPDSGNARRNKGRIEARRPVLKGNAKQQLLADSDAIMQSDTHVVGSDGSIDGMYSISIPPPPPVVLAPPPIHPTPVLMPRPTQLDWSYGGDGHGPQHWGSLNNWGICATGTYQSPINLELNVQEEDNLDMLRWLSPTESYTAMLSPPLLTNTFRLDGLQGSMKFRGEDYTLSHLKLHTPSEHRWQGKQYPMEIQFMHKRSGSESIGLGVSAFLVPGGDDTPAALQPLMRGVDAYMSTDVFAPGGVRVTVPAAAHPAGIIPVPMNTARLMSDVLGYAGNYANYLSYYGSESQPPCREGVNWAVLKTPLPVGKEDYLAVARAQGYTARPTQKVNSRPVLDTATGQAFQTPQLPAQGF